MRNSAKRRFWPSVLVAIVAMSMGGCLFGGSDGKESTTPTVLAGDGTPATTATAAPPTATATTAPASVDFAAADVLLREGRYSDAGAAFRAVAARAGSAEAKAAALVGAATAAIQLRDSKTALVVLREAVAVAPASSSAGSRAAYLLVKELGTAGEFEEANAVYAAAAANVSTSALGLYLGNEGAKALAESGRLPEATLLWEQLVRDPRSSSAFRTEVYKSQAEVAKEQGDLVGRRAALEKVIRETGEPGARLELADVREALGEPGGMVDELRTIVDRDPATSYAGVALARLVELGVGVDPGQAGLVYYRRGSYTQAEAVLLPAVETPGLAANDLAFRAYYLAASYEDSGEREAAVGYYDLAANSGANSVYVHRARYWAARVMEAEGKAGEASRRYVALVRDGPAGEFTQESAFRAGYVLYESGDVSGALTIWNEMQASASARLEYWRGRAYAGSGDSAGARAAYQRAVSLGPYEFHGIEAARELAGATSFDVSYRERNLAGGIEWGAIEQWLRGRIGGGPVERERTAACELISVGLRSEAAAELWSAAAGQGPWAVLSVLREAKECGATDVAAQLAVSLRVSAGVGSGEAPRDLLRVSYPIDYVATLKAESKRAGVDPLFFAALIRQESLWDPGAGSSAGALGLTQVIPATGYAIAGELGVVDFEPEDLFRPAISLEFGAYYLGGQIAQYGDPLLALAAYNAGPGNAVRWGSFGATRPADLAEVVDFVETRTYVTYIYEAYAHYQLAWGD